MNSYKRLFILVEGDDDETFFNTILKPGFEKLYDCVTLWKYSQKQKEVIKNFLDSVNSEWWDADYIFMTDMNDAPCVSARKEKIFEKYESVDKSMIIVVGKEIESWYLAGLDDDKCKGLKIRSFSETDNITKEEFVRLIPSKFAVIDFKVEILKFFDMETAKRKNKSFRYFVEKFGV